jgi:hypothetical protein
MTSFLEKSGETTLLKLDFNINGEEEIKKKNKTRKLRNCSINKKEKVRLFYSFYLSYDFPVSKWKRADNS